MESFYCACVLVAVDEILTRGVWVSFNVTVGYVDRSNFLVNYQSILLDVNKWADC